jgi:enoyl-CoA hydratase
MTERLPISTPHRTVERDGHVVTVTMNRPEARNAFSTDMLVGLADAWAYVSDTPEVRAPSSPAPRASSAPART